MEKITFQAETQRVALLDRIASLEAVNTEIRRLLLKEQHLNSALLPAMNEEEGEPLLPSSPPGCATCARYLRAVHTVRRDNTQEHKWVDHFQKLSHSVQTQLYSRLLHVEAMFSALQTKYDELKRRKDDPLCRDAEIIRLREEVADANRDRSNANRTAVNANKESESLLAQLNLAKVSTSPFPWDRVCRADR